MTELGLEPLPVEASKDLCNIMRRMFSEALKMNPREVNGFPGTMPMTFSRRHADMIRREDYVFLEKSDGCRYFLMIYNTMVYLIDRRTRVYPIYPHPRISQPGNPHESIRDTLVDGELCRNIRLQQYEFLIYDAIWIDGQSVAQESYRKRLVAAESMIQIPRVLSSDTAGLLRFRVKDTYEKSEIELLFSRIKKEGDDYIYENRLRPDGPLCNGNDGLILMPENLAYAYKTCEGLLKWKPPHLNSIDFVIWLEKVPKKGGGMDVSVTLAYQSEKGPTKMRKVILPSAVRAMFAQDFNRYHNTVGEFSYDLQAGEYRYLRQRDDKDKANFHGTVIDTMESIGENVRREEIIKVILSNARTESRGAKRKRYENPALRMEPRSLLFLSPDFYTVTPVSRIPPP